MKRTSVAFIAVCTLGAWSGAHAQDPATHTLRGAVYDSIGHGPLKGSVVQVVRADSGIESRVYTATTDALGKFELAGLPSGRYAIGFQYPVLTSLGVEPRLYALDASTDSLTANLATQSPATVRRLLCATARDAERTGMLSGTIAQANGRAPLDSATVTVLWFELSLVKGKLVSAPMREIVSTDDQGAFRICGVPDDASVRLNVARAGFHALEADVVLDPGELWHREVRLAASDRMSGSGAVSGRVTRADGMAVASGRVTLRALTLEAPIAEGAFSFAELPAGTWILDVSAVGYEPQQLWVDVNEQSSASVRVSMTRAAQKLETVSVVGKAGRDLKVLEGIRERSLVAAGTMILPGNPVLETAMLASDVVRVARGFKMNGEGPTVVEGRSAGNKTKCLSRYSDVPRRMTKLGTDTTKEVAIYLDGERWKMGLEAINSAVPPKDILAVEAYPDVTSAPFLWRTNDACAVIAFWTKR